MVRFTTSEAKDWIRKRIDLDPIREVADEIRSDHGLVGYLGTPGPEILDLLAWESELDFALAAEREGEELRRLGFNASKYLGDGFCQASGLTLDALLARANERWYGTFRDVNQIPCIINYDVYANPVLPTDQRFDARKGLWGALNSYLSAARQELPSVLLMITATLRGNRKHYDAALKGILDEVAESGIKLGASTRADFLNVGMDKKCQVCIPYWITRYCATPNSYGVEIVQSVQYSGTSGVSMMHLVMKLPRFPDDAVPKQSSLPRLLNMTHGQLRKKSTGNFELIFPDYPRIPT